MKALSVRPGCRGQRGRGTRGHPNRFIRTHRRARRFIDPTYGRAYYPARRSKFGKNPEETMQDLNVKNLDPRLVARAAEFVGTRDIAGAAAAAASIAPDMIPGR